MNAWNAQKGGNVPGVIAIPRGPRHLPTSSLPVMNLSPIDTKHVGLFSCAVGGAKLQ